MQGAPGVFTEVGFQGLVFIHTGGNAGSGGGGEPGFEPGAGGPQGRGAFPGADAGVSGARGRASSGRPDRWPAGCSAGAAFSFYVRAGPGTPCPGPRPANNAPLPAARPAAAPRPLPAPRPPGSGPEPRRPRRYGGSRPGIRRGPGRGRGQGRRRPGAGPAAAGGRLPLPRAQSTRLPWVRKGARPCCALHPAQAPTEMRRGSQTPAGLQPAWPCARHRDSAVSKTQRSPWPPAAKASAREEAVNITHH